MAVFSTLRFGDGNAVVVVNYATSNNRITSIEWTVNPSYVGVVKLYDISISPDVPFFDIALSGNSSANVGGQYRLVEIDDPVIGLYLDYPPNIRYQFSLRSI